MIPGSPGDDEADDRSASGVPAAPADAADPGDPPVLTAARAPAPAETTATAAPEATRMVRTGVLWRRWSELPTEESFDRGQDPGRPASDRRRSHGTPGRPLAPDTVGLISTRGVRAARPPDPSGTSSRPPGAGGTPNRPGGTHPRTRARAPWTGPFPGEGPGHPSSRPPMRPVRSGPGPSRHCRGRAVRTSVPARAGPADRTRSEGASRLIAGRRPAGAARLGCSVGSF